MDIPITGLTPYGLRRPFLPDACAFLARDTWNATEHAAELHAFLRADVRLLAGLRWLRCAPERDALRGGTPEEVDQLLDDLGLDLVREAALALILFRSFRVGRCEELDYDDHWSRALARGLAAKHLARHFGLEVPERAFLAGLFAGLGQLVLAESFPERYADLLTDVALTPRQLVQRERERFGIDRDGAAWALLRDLGFGRAVFEPMLAQSRALRGDHRTPAGDPMALEVQRMAHLLGDIICAEASERTALWGQLVALRTQHDLNRDLINALADEVVGEWWYWGDLLVIPTRTLPGFAELCDWNERDIAPVRYNPIRTGGLVADEQRGGLRVLIVDDQRLMVRAIRSQLERAGLQVDTAGSGEEALAKLRQNPPQVVLSDWHMPGMDGLELCRNLRRTELGQRVFFILFTAEENEIEIVKAYEDGINDFISKTSRPAILLARIMASRTFLAHWESTDRDRRIIRTHCDRSRKLAVRMRRDSMTDALTGLPNRRFAMERLREEWARSQRSGEHLSVLMMDIDHFKGINDKHGHDVGDLVLQDVSATLREHARRNETVCRIGGEEFLVICSDASLSDAGRCGERLRRAVHDHVARVDGRDHPVTISLGVAQRTALVTDLDELLKGADEAVYAAKEGGRDRVVLWPSLERVDLGQDERDGRLAG